MTTFVADYDITSGADLPGELEDDFPWEDVDEATCERCNEPCDPSPLGICRVCEYAARRDQFFAHTETPHAAELAGVTA